MMNITPEEKKPNYEIYVMDFNHTPARLLSRNIFSDREML